jgi:ABC-type multidrug transport system fused ATPase/permease subunit
MDEATSNIDEKTDFSIQRVVKNHLNATTVISIAHRIITVIQYDKLIVLKDGCKIEEGTPLELLMDSNSLFCEYVEAGGQEFKEKMIFYA